MFSQGLRRPWGIQGGELGVQAVVNKFPGVLRGAPLGQGVGHYLVHDRQNIRVGDQNLLGVVRNVADQIVQFGAVGQVERLKKGDLVLHPSGVEV